MRWLRLPYANSTAHPPRAPSQPLSALASILPWDLPGLAATEAAHKAESERIRQAKLEQERYLREIAKREEDARQASLYRARHDELSQNLLELEAEEATAAETYSR